MTREHDLEGDQDHYLSPQERAQICNSYNPDIAVSIHTNRTYSPRWDGSITLVRDGINMPMADMVHPIMYSGLKTDWDGRFTVNDINQEEWIFPKHSAAPAVILEPVFLSNRDEAAALRATLSQDPDGQRAQIVQVIYDGIMAHFSRN
jgi:N-acetylmuramoyl-L-alanine amidase